MFSQYYYNPLDYNDPPENNRNCANDPEDFDGCLSSIVYTITWILVILVSLLMCSSCTTTKYVTVPEVHEIHHHHTDSVHQIDSVVNDRQTVVMMLDSMAMEQYGIQLKQAERAFLVKVRELEREIQIVREQHTDTVHQIDSVPVPVPVNVEVEKPLSWWQKMRLCLGDILLAAIIAAAIYGAFRLYLRLRP